MISVLSAVVLMLAIGTVIQRADLVGDYFGGETDVVLNMDVVDARANRLLRIDVFDNDIGISASDRDRLALIGEPSCGQVFIQGQALQYLPDYSCVGQAVIEYGIKGRSEVVGKVVAQVNAPNLKKPTAVKKSPGTESDKAPADNDVAAQQLASSDLVKESEPAASLPSGEPAQQDVTDVEVQISEVAPKQSERGLAVVVDTLIQGSAQSVQAASAKTDAPEAQVETGAESETTQAELSLAEPDLQRIAGAPLTSPQTDIGQENIEAGQNPEEIALASPTSTLAPYTQTQPSEAVKPQIAVTTPVLQILQPREQRPVEPANNVDLAVATGAATGAERAPRRALQSGERDLPSADEPSDFLVAVVERREPNTRPPSSLRMTPGDELSLQTAPNAVQLPNAEGVETRIARSDPLSSVHSPDAGPVTALSTSPVDDGQLPLDPNSILTSTPPPLKPRLARAGDASTPVETPQALADATANRGEVPDSPVEPSSGQLAALPKHDAPCVIPPAMTIDVRRAARSIVSVDAPCHADTVAELQYSGLHVAMPLDRFGKGALTVLGFEPNAPALLTFVNGETIDFDLPFKGISRVSRVAVVWDLPVHLELNAIEFGAGLGSADHVRPDNPREFEDVRRSGGGFLDGYRSHSGIGQNAQIYSFYHRRGGQQGVVELMIDYASRNRDRLEGTCGDGQYAAPNFLILRSIDARLDRPVIRKLAALDCSRVVEEKGDKRLISGAVADLLVVQR